MAEQTNTPPGIFERVEEFDALYANNVQIEQSVFDLKMVFGQLDQSQPGKMRVEQHTSITISWVQAKLLLFYLQLNIAGYESQNGKIKIPDDVMPVPIPPLTPEQENDPKFRELFEVFKAVRDQFIANL
jgi:hypothetical protein